MILESIIKLSQHDQHDFFDSLTGGPKDLAVTPKTARNDQKQITQDLVDTLFDLSLNYLLSNFIAEQIATAVMYLSFYRLITTTTTENGLPVTNHNNIC